MNWLKLHHGTPSDPKWAVIAKRSGMPRHAVVAVWCALLDHASQNTPRGSIARLDAELVAVSLDLETDQVNAIVTAMRERNVLTDDTVTNWTKRQTGTSTERVRRFRERSASDGNGGKTQNETVEALRNTDETIDKNRTEQRRTESSEDKSSGADAPPPAGDVSRETDPWKQIYAGLKRHLGTKSGGLISKLRQVSGEAEMANWLDACDRGEIADPREYFSKIIAAREGKPPPNEKPDPEKAFRQKAQMVAKGMRSKEMYSMQELDRMINEGLVTQEQAKVFGWKDPFEFRVLRPATETEALA